MTDIKWIDQILAKVNEFKKTTGQEPRLFVVRSRLFLLKIENELGDLIFKNVYGRLPQFMGMSIAEDITLSVPFEIRGEKMTDMSFEMKEKTELEKLMEENARLRNVLESIAQTDVSDKFSDYGWLQRWRHDTKDKAYNALKGSSE